MKSGPVPPTGAIARWIGASSSISDGPLKEREGSTPRIVDRARVTGGESRGKIQNAPFDKLPTSLFELRRTSRAGNAERRAQNAE